MTERFSDEVLQRVWMARIERETAWRDQHGIDPATECAEANAAGLAAMRAVLEEHAAAQKQPMAHTCDGGMNPPFPYPCKACEQERSDGSPR